MKVIELIGPAGAGKTTFAESKFNSPNIYAGREDREKCYLDMVSGGDLLTYLPDPVRHRVVQRIFSCKYPHHARKFYYKHPGILETMAVFAQNYEIELICLPREAAWYQIHSSQLHTDEIYVSDDGFYQFFLRLLSGENWSASRILDIVPVPDKFVFVDAPEEVCLARQKTRSRGVAPRLAGLNDAESLSELSNMRSESIEVINEAEKMGISVERVVTT